MAEHDPERLTAIGRVETIDERRHPWAVLVGLVAMVAVIVVGVIGLGAQLAPDEDRHEVAQVVVPRMAGRTFDEARSQLEVLGLIVDVRYEPNERIPLDVVVEQEPIAGAKTEVGQQVVLTVSDGPAGLRVPDLTNLSAPEAQRLLSGMELPSTIESVFDEYVDQNQIVSSDPRAGSRVMPGDTIRVLVSQGPRPRVVPDVVGMASPAGLAEIGRAELTIEKISRVVDADAVPGTIRSTDPAAGAEVLREQPISVVVVEAPERQPVPEFVGLTRANAEKLADRRDVRLDVVTESLSSGDVRSGRVIRQEAIAGSPHVDVVRVVVGVAPSPPPTTAPAPTTAPPAAPTVPAPGPGG